MADYYPLLARAVAGLKTSTPETRRAIYERARNALIAQLRGMKPPVPEPDILRESAALDAAVARLEAELARPAEPDPVANRAEEERKAEEARRAEAARLEETQRKEAARRELARRLEAEETERRNQIAAAAEAAQAERERDIRAAEARAERARREAETARPATSADAAPKAPAPFEPVSASPRAQAGRADAPPVAAPRMRAPGHTAGEPARVDFDEAMDLDGGRHAVAPEPGVDRDARRPARPAAPTPPVERQSSLRYVVMGMSLALVMGGIGATAWYLRDQPQPEPSSLVPAPGASAPAPAPEAGKIPDRATPGAAPTAPLPTVSVPTQTVRPTAEPAPAAPPATTRGAFLIQNPAGPEPHTIYAGSTSWSGAGGVWRAEVTAPEAKLTMSFAMSRSADDGLASHRIELRFRFDDPERKINRVGAPEMRRDDQPYGDRVAGVAVQVTPDFYLVGLRKDEADIAFNMELFRTRGWIDIPIEMSDKRIAKVTIEKGAAGEAALAEASKAW